MSDARRLLPGVDRLLEAAGGLVDEFGHSEVAEALRLALEQARSGADQAAADTPASTPKNPVWSNEAEAAQYCLAAAQAHLRARARPSLRRVLNATGVVLHTNLGRAPLAEVAAEAAREATSGYSNLEFDLESGSRGSRYDHARGLLAELTGAEDALVVNNCAAGLLLALSAAARDRDVVISRGELVEIGGGFRIPEVMERAGATLVEVGTTNRTRIEDYSVAAESVTVAALLKVHRSNFNITGFTESVTPVDLVELAVGKGLRVIHDLGSGLMIDAARLTLPNEPGPADSIAAGVDAVVFSGDKLLGGPQAGLIAGRADLIERMRRDPFCRAFRVDKGTLAALEATLRLYRDSERAVREIPTLRALARTRTELAERCEQIVSRLAAILGDSVTIDSIESEGRVGGGTYPEHPLASMSVRIRVAGAGDAAIEEWARACRTVERVGLVPVVGRIEDGGWLLDPRAVPVEDEPALIATVAGCFPQ